MSTPRPAKSPDSATTRPVFCWTFPGAPIRISLPLDVVSRLRAELGQHENSGYRIPRVDAGGVLLGHRVTPTMLEIDDYLWVSSKEQPGSRYSLDTSALQRLREGSSARPDNARRSEVVGYFRTEAEDQLHLRGEEIDLVMEYFRDPTDVVLLIRTADKSYTSGFLFWMPGGDFVPFSLLDFPLDEGLLQANAEVAVAGQANNDRGITGLVPNIADKAATPPGESESTSGARPMSIPSEDVSFNLRLRAHPEWPQGRRSGSQAGGQVTQRHAPDQRQPTDPSEPFGVTPPETVSILKGEAIRVLTPPSADAQRKEKPARFSPRVRIAAAAVFLFLAFATLSAFLLRDRGPAGRKKTPPAITAFPLQMDVEAQGEGLNIRWNPQSVAVTQAREGHLAILEGSQQTPRIIPLDAQQLTSGHIYYRSSAERVQFQLEIVAKSGGISRESVLALSSTPAPAVSRVAAPQTANGPIPMRKVESIPIPNANAGALQPANATDVAPDRPPAPRTFTAPLSTRDRSAQIPAITFEQAPAISTNTIAPPVALPATLNNLLPNNPPAPQGKAPPATKARRVGSLESANLIKSVAPIYPPLALSEHIQGTVRFTATIGKDGTVQNLQLTGGNPALVKAATDAVKQWLYRPTLLNGEPVEAVTQIEVKFTMNR